MTSEIGQKKNWTDLKGNPTTNDDETHWDEEGLLDIREEYVEETDSPKAVKPEPKDPKIESKPLYQPVQEI